MTTHDGAVGDARKRLADQTPTDAEIGPQIAADEFADVLDEIRVRHKMLPARGGSSDIGWLLAALDAARAEVERLRGERRTVAAMAASDADCGTCRLVGRLREILRGDF